MSGRKNKGQAIDDLLRRALADELPADVQAGMRERIERFRAEKRAAVDRSPAKAWLSGRPVWVTVSILMLLAGILLQGAKRPSPLAGRISSLKAAYANLETIRR